ncbi:MAG: hypothetical protein CMP49_03690 [Flavobacteriales bacterium]|nr:hypothetical protein [Flavobacteriales bacterium]|tara:strand:+ start:5867 stop:6112 length:246 start_codon:yes stop_codon:yes gene_type:complete
MILKIFINGYAILLVAILANLIADVFHISTWYKFIQNCYINGIYKTIISENLVSLVWLFIIYPIILTGGYVLGNKIYDFLI